MDINNICANCGKPTPLSMVTGKPRLYCGHLCTRYMHQKRNRKKLNARSSAWYAAHPQVRRAVTEKYIANRYRKYGRLDPGPITRARREFLDILKHAPCQDCEGWFPPVCMDWDHKDPKSKKMQISEFRSKKCTKAEIITEIQKCDLVCANCHRVRTQNRKRISKYAITENT